MDIRALRYFLAVAQERSFTNAATRLHVAQPTLSKQVKALEHELGKQLIVRGHKEIALTEDGTILYKRAEEIVTLADKARQELSASTREPTGEVAIGGNAVPTVLKAAANLRKQHSGVRFRFYTGDATDVCERLDHGSLDFAVLLAPVDDTRYSWRALPDQSRWGILVPPESTLAQKHAISPQDLQSLPLVLHTRPGIQRMVERWAGLPLDSLEVVATYNVLNRPVDAFVESGLGYPIVADDLLPATQNNRAMFLPLNPPLRTSYALAWHRHSTLSHAAQTFLEHIG